jgi:hypothetical protein
MLMKKVQARQVVIYTRDEGPVPAYSVHLYCEGVLLPFGQRVPSQSHAGCHVNYHHDYRVENGQRVYYETIPDVLQVGEHQFVERRLIDMWINLMLVAWCVPYFLFGCNYEFKFAPGPQLPIVPAYTTSHSLTTNCLKIGPSA